jgi:hypothetical protein
MKGIKMRKLALLLFCCVTVSCLAQTAPSSNHDVAGAEGAVQYRRGNAHGAVTPGTAGQRLAQGATYAAWVTDLRQCVIVVGAETGSALTDSQLAGEQRCYFPSAATIQEVTVYADGGVPQVIVHKRRGTTNTDVVSAALATGASGIEACAATTTACLSGVAKSGTVTIVTAASANVLAAGDTLGLTSGTAGGVAKRMTIVVTYKLN